jgi:hypothetical protein
MYVVRGPIRHAFSEPELRWRGEDHRQHSGQAHHRQDSRPLERGLGARPTAAGTRPPGRLSGSVRVTTLTHFCT